MDLKQLFYNGVSFSEFVKSENNEITERLKSRYDNIALDGTAVNFKNKVRYVLAFAENWCPDCQVSVPIMAKLCDLAKIDFKILKREGHEEEMKPFYEDGKAKIPTFAFLDDSFNVVGTWIERPKVIKELVAKGDNSYRRGYVNGEYDKDIVNELLEMMSR
ncbi:thioredoxin family protein [Thermoanaerobacterium thermosaccharolyticum]|uniref:thioredoxin family protein n=1 Tax=Thermoanaerobacterium thermosaccharolyticum TaxID=1517 RepID=UPI003D2A622D